ncbi:tRNA (5-methylaminomethyl-2-thiouridine)(34)-methyltransferase MnmD [Phenylobacterium sp.]|jgi:tRNA 5-methylaminomethyl-2-thiouridine biosynthesis bifunctional protein|uniref:tRNA (5-methylaminomethyl-2-thiouridine)(34)-methyltransferase MnmD n=1 Tax=Phenylobacterium sp. TaxID=1871053 RepID=UPI003784ED81
MSADPPADAERPLAGSCLDWGDDGQPRSRLYGDVYFSTEDGLAESRAVFLQGCRLPEAWRGRRRFVVGELGFGTGLNILALLDLWRRSRQAGQRLHVLTTEAHPIGADEAARAHARWPELAELSAALLDHWPGRARGVHRIDLPALGATLDVAVGEAGESLAGWTGRADAWFLDGFSPALNPAMWRDELMALVGARSAPGARAATFTVAGHVRRALAAAGFQVDKRPGFGRKRERLEAAFPGVAAETPARRVAIVGAGIAGAALARAVRVLGGEAVVVDAEGRGAGASGNPAALVTPRLDAGLGVPAALFARAFARAAALYEAETPDAVIARGVLQRAQAPRDGARFAKIAASDLFEPGALTLSDAGLFQAAALTVEPARILAGWAPDVVPARVAAVARGGDAWVLRDADGAEIAQAEVVVLAAGLAIRDLSPDLALAAVRGQASWAATAEPPGAMAWGGYVAPTRQGLLFGATHDRVDEGVDMRPEDHARNLATLAQALPELAAALAGGPLEGRAAVRAVTPDRLPLAGRIDDGLYVLGGLGSRGFSFAPLLAEHVAALALGAPSPLPEAQARLVDPLRFRDRRGGPILAAGSGDTRFRDRTP